MANSTKLNTRLCLRRDDFNNWETVKETFVPLKGEACVIVVPASSGAVVQEPAVLIKIGDGTNKLKDLPYVSAMAADVYAWAKATNKPTYTASEITGLSDYISGSINDTNTKYTIEKDVSNGHKLKLMKKDVDDDDYSLVVEVTTEDTVYNDSDIHQSISSLETLIGDLPVSATSSTIVGYIDEKVAMAAHLKRTKVDSADDIDLDADNADQYIYMVTKTGGKTGDEYDEYMVLDGKLEKVGNWAVDLDEYAKTADLGDLAAKDKVTKSDLESVLGAELDGKANSADLSDIAASGDAKDLTQTDGDYLVLNGGTATTVI